MDLAWEAPEENLTRAEVHVARAAADGAALVVLPEMFATGFSMRAEEMAAHERLIVEGARSLARRHSVFLVAGFADQGAARPRNAAGLFDTAGVERARYHKLHPFSLANEHAHFDAGEALHTVTIDAARGPVRVTPLICYDLRFPEPFRVAAAQTDLFVVIANWPEARREAWRALLRARAIENQCYVLGVNRVGAGNGLSYSGDSALLSPFGEVISEAAGTEALIRGEVDAEAVREARARFGFLADRRPELYRALGH
jgi:predicted amidohydrolase